MRTLFHLLHSSVILLALHPLNLSLQTLKNDVLHQESFRVRICVNLELNLIYDAPMHSLIESFSIGMHV